MQKRQRKAWLAMAAMAMAWPAAAESTIDPAERYGWLANAGWVDFFVTPAVGAAFDERVGSGYLWGTNVGWIHLGDGTPDFSEHYSNASASDYGVNVTPDPANDRYLLSGYGWSANAGWISFDVGETAGEANRPRIERATGRLAGYAWSGNLGWLALAPAGGGVRSEPAENAAASWLLYE